MTTTQRPTSANTVNDILRDAQGLLRRLCRAVRDGIATQEAFDESRAALEALPLTTRDFSLAVCRIGNASRYYAQREAEVAAYELALVEKCLAKVL